MPASATWRPLPPPSDGGARGPARRRQVAAARIEPLLALFDELVGHGPDAGRVDLEDQATAAEDSSTGLHTAVTEARGRAHEAHALFDGANERV